MSNHQANPFLEEPTPFKEGIVSKLTDEQWRELFTPGSPIKPKPGVEDFFGDMFLTLIPIVKLKKPTIQKM